MCKLLYDRYSEQKLHLSTGENSVDVLFEFFSNFSSGVVYSCFWSHRLYYRNHHSGIVFTFL